MSHCDATKYGHVSHVYKCLTFTTTCLSSPVCKVSNAYCHFFLQVFFSLMQRWVPNTISNTKYASIVRYHRQKRRWAQGGGTQTKRPARGRAYKQQPQQLHQHQQRWWQQWQLQQQQLLWQHVCMSSSCSNSTSTGCCCNNRGMVATTVAAGATAVVAMVGAAAAAQQPQIFLADGI